MRQTFIVTYDIRDSKRLRRTFKTCKDYGTHLQFSVFECDLNPRERAELETKLSEVIDHEKDQVLFISLGPSEMRGARSISSIGTSYQRFDEPCYAY